MQSSNIRKLLVCGLLIITMVPVLLSTFPGFQASATHVCPNLCGGDPGKPGGGHQGNLQTTRNLQYNDTTTTSTDSSDSMTTST